MCQALCPPGARVDWVKAGRHSSECRAISESKPGPSASSPIRLASTFFTQLHLSHSQPRRGLEAPRGTVSPQVTSPFLPAPSLPPSCELNASGSGRGGGVTLTKAEKGGQTSQGHRAIKQSSQQLTSREPSVPKLPYLEQADDENSLVVRVQEDCGQALGEL